MDHPNNRITAAGRLEGKLQPSHEVAGEVFYEGTLSVKRLSGTVDRLPVIIPGRLLAVPDIIYDRSLLVSGQVRSYSKVVDGAGRLMVKLFAQDIGESGDNETPLNCVTLEGTICRPATYRKTPFGREICDIMLAVNRAFGKSDYIPCIAWGRNARFASRFRVGDRIQLTGRLQSREYEKQLENGECITRTVYEVSTFAIKPADDAKESGESDALA